MTKDLENIIKATQEKFDTNFVAEPEYGYTAAPPSAIKLFLSAILCEAIKAAFEATAVEEKEEKYRGIVGNDTSKAYEIGRELGFNDGVQKVRERQEELLKP